VGKRAWHEAFPVIVLRDGQSYREVGGDYFERLNADRLTRYHTKRLAALGYAVTLTKCAA